MSKIEDAKKTVEDLGELAEAIKKSFGWIKPAIMSVIIMLGGGTILESNGTIDLTPMGEGDDWAWEDDEYYPYYGCTDDLATNYDSYADADDGTCDYQTELVYGCTDDTANNYDYEAIEDDGTCEYDTEPTYGCTDDTANNYDTTATEDDGTCDYDPEPTEGCTDDTATNYDEDATEDDGSCEYPPSVECEPVIYSLFVRYDDANNSSLAADIDVDCTNAGVTETVTIQFLAYPFNTTGVPPSNWTEISANITGEAADTYTLRLGNFSNGSYDLYVYVSWDADGEGLIERKFLNVEINEAET